MYLPLYFLVLNKVDLVFSLRKGGIKKSERNQNEISEI